MQYILFVIFFSITDTLLPFDVLSILILDKLCMNLLCLYNLGILFSFSKLELF